jgi:hypothetical protein
MVECFHRCIKDTFRARCSSSEWTSHILWCLLAFRSSPQSFPIPPQQKLFLAHLWFCQGNFPLLQRIALPITLWRSNSSSTPPPASDIPMPLITTPFVFILAPPSHHPFSPPYSSPYKGLRKFPHTFLLQMADHLETISVSSLKPFHLPPNTPSTQPPLRGCPPLPKLSSSILKKQSKPDTHPLPRSLSGFHFPPPTRVGNFRQKNYSAEDGIDGTIGLFRRNSGCSAEQKTLGIPFRTVPQKRRMLGILYNGTKIEANSRIFVLNHSVEQKTLGILFRTVPQRRKMLGISFRKARNELFLPRNNGSHSESIPRNFFGTKFRCQPYHLLPPVHPGPQNFLPVFHISFLDWMKSFYKLNRFPINILVFT